VFRRRGCKEEGSELRYEEAKKTKEEKEEALGTVVLGRESFFSEWRGEREEEGWRGEEGTVYKGFQGVTPNPFSLGSVAILVKKNSAEDNKRRIARFAVTPRKKPQARAPASRRMSPNHRDKESKEESVLDST